MEKIGGSICFQLIDIFNIIEDKSLSEEQKRAKIIEYQKSLTQEGNGILIDSERKDGQCKKNGYFVFGDVDVMSYEDLVKTKQYVDNNLTSFTCEAEMKMTALLGGYDKGKHEIIYRFGMADKVYDYAISHGKAMRGHTLVWHNHQPKALDDYIQDHYNGNMEDDKTNNPEQFRSKRKELTKSFLTEYMKNVGERYPNCYCWDVINEIVPDVHTPKPSEQERNDGLRHSKWFEYLGKDFYIDVLEIAKDNLPEGTKLFYNEYGEQNPEKRKAIIQVIENIKKYEQQTGKVLLDGIGLQSHYDLNTTEQQIEDIYKDFSSTGKEIQVTEMDVAPGYDKNGHHAEYNPQNMPQYAKIWSKVFSCAQKYDVKAFTGWGISDALSCYKNIGCTMIAEDGSIKDFAREFFENRQQKSAEQGITLQDIGKGTTKSFTQNPERAMKAMESLEYGVRTQEEVKEV